MCFMETLPNRTQAAADPVAQRLMTMLNEAALAMMISVGHRTGLFDTLATMPGATSATLAHAARLNERYVREWLGALTTSGIVKFDPQTGRYRLCTDYAPLLTRNGDVNFAATCQFISVLGEVESRIVDCFRNGGGVPYREFPRFHEVMAEESDQTVCAALLAHILPLAPGLVARLERGIDALDVGCGRGHAVLALAERFPNSRVTGYDFSTEAIAHAQAEAARRGLTNARFAVRDVAELNETDRYDLVTAFDAVHDQAHPARVLAQVASALRPDGVFLVQDIDGSRDVAQNIDHPLGTFLYTISCMHCMTVSLAEGGDGLGTMWGRETAVEMLAEAGFDDVHAHRLEHDIMNVFFVARRAS